MNATAHALEMQRHAPPWANRTDKLWFRGQIWRGGGNDARRAVAQFLRGNHPDGNPWAEVLDIAEGGVAPTTSARTSTCCISTAAPAAAA